MSISHGVFLDFDSVHPQDLNTTGLETTLADWKLHPTTAPDQVAVRIASAEVVISNKVVLDESVIKGESEPLTIYDGDKQRAAPE